MKKLLLVFSLIISLFLSGCSLESFFQTESRRKTDKPLRTTLKSITNRSIPSENITLNPIEKDIDKDVNNVYIVSINDTHGQLTSSSNGNMGMAEVGGLIDYLEDEVGQPYIKICNGDLFQGSYVARQTYGLCFIDALNALNFDIFVPGNHEFDWGLDKISIYWDKDLSNGEANFPFVCCNLIDTSINSRPSFCDPYAIVEYGNIKVGVIGAIGDDLESSVSSTYLSSYIFDDLDNYVSKYSKELKEEKGCDLVILSVHDYSDDDKYSCYITDYGYSLDAIIFGHSHQSLEGYYTHRFTNNKIPYIQSYTKNLNIGTITISLDNKKFKNASINHYNYNYYTYHVGAPNEACLNAIKKYQSLIEEGSSIIVRVDDYTYRDKASCGDLAARAMMDFLGGDIGIINTGGVRTYIKNNDITYADINEIFPFDNVLCYGFMTGKNLKRYLSYNSGVYTNESFRERDLKDDLTYKVCTIDYVVTNYGYFTDLCIDNKVYYTTDILRDVVTDFLKK